LACRDPSIFGLGVVGFDLDDLGWDASCIERERAFLLAVLQSALRHEGWSLLTYAPPPELTEDNLRKLRRLLVDYVLPPTPGARAWAWQEQAPASFTPCARCGVYLHIAGCVVCNAT